MEAEAILRERVTLRVQQGKLPNCQPARTWGGPGLGVKCMVCDQPIQKNELEFEVEFTRPAGLDLFHAHIKCYAVWTLSIETGGDVLADGSC